MSGGGLSPVIALVTSVGLFEPGTGEEKAWIYERTSATECTVKSAPYHFEGKEVVLSLRGKDGEVEEIE